VGGALGFIRIANAGAAIDQFEGGSICLAASRPGDSRKRDMKDLSIGFRVKSGWAAAVLLTASDREPRVVERRRVQLADPAVPDSAQPYHLALELPKAAGAKVIARLIKSTRSFAGHAISDLVKDCERQGYLVRAAGLVVGSDADPQKIKNDHIRAHAEEGRLFRVVIEEPLRQIALEPMVTPEKYLYETASKILGVEEARLKLELKSLGRTVSGSWRAEDKSATLAAWIALRRTWPSAGG
jgi:hypothetical protein